MFERRSLKLPVTLGVLMILTIIALTVGWILLALSNASYDSRWAPLYWTLLSVGTAFLVFVLVGVVMYLTLSIETINLNRRQSNFIDSVTHELKSPIASLKLYLQTLGRRQVSRAEQEDFFRFMLDDVERLDHLINHLLDAARLDNGVIDSEVEDILLEPVLQRCIQEVCVRYRISTDIVELSTEPVVIRAKLVDLDLVFRNLIDNAVKYAGKPPKVLITSSPKENGSSVTRICDNGNGVPPKLRRKIFGRFFRLGEELRRETPGTGLGLYIVRILVRRLHGKVRVRDRDGQPGTVFEVTLPRIDVTPTVGKTRPTHQQTPTPRAKRA